MKILVIGLGSMGKRRVRNILAIGGYEVAGFDLRADRNLEASTKYGIRVFSSFESAVTDFQPTVFIISTPPNFHMDYAFYALQRSISCFIEASVTDFDRVRELSVKSIESTAIFAPSCTMGYYFGPTEIKRIIESHSLGKILNINYQSGQYLPDWHPWEDIRDFYVSNKETGGCREIVPFELTWLNKIFGNPVPLACVKSKQTNMPSEIDDIYHAVMRYESGAILNLTVDVISRPIATRHLRIYGSEGILVWDYEQNKIFVSTVSSASTDVIDLALGSVEKDYINPEEPYIQEMKDFLDAVKFGKKELFPNTLNEDVRVLSLLYELEKIAVKE